MAERERPQRHRAAARGGAGLRRRRPAQHGAGRLRLPRRGPLDATASGRRSAPPPRPARSRASNADQARYAAVLRRAAGSGISCWMRDEEHIEKAFDFGGMPARNGVAAAAMVAAGFTGVDDVFSGERNFFVAYDESRRIGSAPEPQRLVQRARHDLRDHEHQHQALVGGLADPGAARFAARPDPRARHQGAATSRSSSVRVVAPGRQHHRQPRHAGHLHAAHVRGDAARRHRHLRVRPRREAHEGSARCSRCGSRIELVRRRRADAAAARARRASSSSR